MKCPKCGYLGFEAVERCRNCGYDFSLTPVQALPELPLRAGRTSSRTAVDELPLSPVSSGTEGARAAQEGRDVIDDVLANRGARVRTTTSDGGRAIESADLPLFGTPATDQAPLVAIPVKPRAPLSVRRSTPDRGARRTVRTRAPTINLPPPSQEPRKATVSDVRTTELRGEGGTAPGGLPSAGLASRVVAAAIDLGVLGVIDLAVGYLTLRICGLTLAELALVPKAPFILFLIVQNGGYLVVFNAGGQTLGKMLAGIRVVSLSSDGPLDVSHSVVRAAVWIVMAVPAGLGFLSAILNDDRRGFHDRCAGSRVIRVSPA